MKKVLFVSLLCVLTLSLTGCFLTKKGTVTCTLDPTNEIVEAIGEMPKQEVIIDYKGKKITKATANYIYSTNDVAKEAYDNMLAIAKNDKARTNFKLKGNMIMDVANTDDVINLALGNSDNKVDKSKDKIIASLKAQKFICK